MAAHENTVTYEFPAEEMSKQAQGNANAFALLGLAFLKEKGQSAAEWVEFFGRRVAPGWDGVKGHGASAVARVVALNLASLGATVHRLSGDERNAEVTVSNWPAQDMLELTGLTRADTTPLWDSFRPIAEYLNLCYEWQEEEGQVQLRLSCQE